VSECRAGAVRTFYVHPSEFGLRKTAVEEIAGGDAAENAAILKDVLSGADGPRRDVVLLNAGAALFVAGAAETVEAGIDRAAAAIDDGSAAGTLQRLVDTSRVAAGERV
jgi:anthranilate phosphoribosyltransferase